MRKTHFVALLVTALLASGCVTVPDTTHYTVAGRVARGMLGQHTIDGPDLLLNYCEMIDFLEPQPERETVVISGTTIQDYTDEAGPCADRIVQPTPERPATKQEKRAGAVAMSAVDMTKEKTAMELACRELGSKCEYEKKKTVASLRAIPQTRTKNGKTDEEIQ